VLETDQKKASNEGKWLTRRVGHLRENIHAWRRRGATAGIGLLALMMAYGVVFGHNGLIAFEQKRTEAQQLDLQKAQLQRENEKLKEHADRLQSDPSAIEHEAREDLHYTRSGEVIVTLPAQAKGSAPALPSAR